MEVAPSTYKANKNKNGSAMRAAGNGRCGFCISDSWLAPFPPILPDCPEVLVHGGQGNLPSGHKRTISTKATAKIRPTVAPVANLRFTGMDAFGLEHDPEGYRRSDRNSTFSLRATLRVLKDDPLEARAKLNDRSLVIPFPHWDLAAEADDLGHGVYA
jgi:hypothetical protein